MGSKKKAKKKVVKKKVATKKKASKKPAKKKKPKAAAEQDFERGEPEKSDEHDPHENCDHAHEEIPVADDFEASGNQHQSHADDDLDSEESLDEDGEDEGYF